jgi:catechol 2,3-dioxygenase-like lactoylglutathione lyase family enzyme
MTSLHHAAIFVSDLERSTAFYRELLGLTENGRVTLDALGIEQVFLSGGTRQADLVLARRLDGAAPPPGRQDKRELFHLAYELPAERSYADFLDAVRRDGIALAGEPMEHSSQLDGTGTRDSVYLFDPDGYVVEVTKERA